MASHESFHTLGNSIASPSVPPTPADNNAPPPPPPPKSSSHHPSRSGTPSGSSAAPYTAAQSQRQSTPGPPPLPQTPLNSSQPPPVAQSFPQIQNLSTNLPALDSGWLPDGLKEYSTADLQPLVNNAELLDAFSHQHPAYQASLEPLQTAISTNLALAQHVAQVEAQVKQLRVQTGQLLLNHTSLQTQWRRKQSEMDDALSSWGPRAMYSRLVSSINEQEALLRAVHESFVEGGGESQDFYGSADGKATEKEVTEWVKRIREGTTVLEKRREMRQRWDEGRVGGWR